MKHGTDPTASSSAISAHSMATPPSIHQPSTHLPQSNSHLVGFGLDSIKNVLKHASGSSAHHHTATSFLQDAVCPVNFGDNDAQVKVIQHHYVSEFGIHSMNELLKDYRDDSVLYTLVNNIPHTFRGRADIQEALTDFIHMARVQIQHAVVEENHAQVVWEATKGNEKVIGTDSFTFDEDNHIKSQTIVAVTQEAAGDLDDKMKQEGEDE